MTLSVRMLAIAGLTGVLAYFMLTTPVQAAGFTRDLLSGLAAIADSGIVFLHHLGTDPTG